ncbi:hypothetical protein CMO91_04230 [Candidatus Woesearchaeota archaeon]|nr:hypothetical protein [Candidatus Woesearchaeota archaeon]|tara:strand:+ start:800 stop:1246 length:447 start_codon:yes stop_codon:yes gene_type:complete
MPLMSMFAKAKKVTSSKSAKSLDVGKSCVIHFSKPVDIVLGQRKVWADSLLLAHSTPMRLELSKATSYKAVKQKTFVLQVDQPLKISVRGCQHSSKTIKDRRHFSKEPHTALAGRKEQGKMQPVCQTDNLSNMTVTLEHETEVLVHLA